MKSDGRSTSTCCCCRQWWNTTLGKYPPSRPTGILSYLHSSGALYLKAHICHRVCGSLSYFLCSEMSIETVSHCYKPILSWAIAAATSSLIIVIVVILNDQYPSDRSLPLLVGKPFTRTDSFFVPFLSGGGLSPDSYLEREHIDMTCDLWRMKEISSTAFFVSLVYRKLWAWA